jgi:hypothetical protein
LHIGAAPSQIEEKKGSPLVVTGGNRFALSDDIWIERLEEELAKDIQRACEPPHYNVGSVVHERHLYAFVRRVPAFEKSSYEGMDELLAVVALSRLIHPTSVGNRYCARVSRFGLKDPVIWSTPYKGISPDAIVSSNHRDWLSVEDAENLRRLMPWLWGDKPMHGRVHRAYWNHEYAMRSLYLDMRWILVVSGLEALLSVGEKHLGRQLRDRGRQLATEFGIDLTDADLRRAYKLRSKLVHGESFLHGLGTILPESQHSQLYMRLESLLRDTVRRCLLDENFGRLFRDDAAVEARWPLKPKPPTLTKEIDDG